MSGSLNRTPHHYLCEKVRDRENSHVGMFMRKPSDVGVTNAPCSSPSGRLRVVVRVFSRS